MIDFFEFNRKPAEILLTDCYVQKQFASRCLLFNVSKLDLSDFFSQHPRFVGINNEQVYRERVTPLISGLLHFFSKLNSGQYIAVLTAIV